MNKPGRVLLRVVLIVLLTGCGGDAHRDTSLRALRDPPEGFRQAMPGMTVSLPEDMGPHPEYRLEWWYLTANLHSADGKRFGVQWTLFRNGLQPGPYKDEELGWQRKEIWLAHAALSRPGDHRFAARSARGGTGQAGVLAQPFKAWIDNWQLARISHKSPTAAAPERALSGFPSAEVLNVPQVRLRAPAVAKASHATFRNLLATDLSEKCELESCDPGTWKLVVDAEDFRYRLQLQPSPAPVLNGEQGFSAKSASGGGSMYFSYPLLTIEGEVIIDGERFEVSGQGWFDREWSSQYLKPDQEGWDWLALHLEDGRHLMLFRVRGAEDFYSGTLVSADGNARTLDTKELSLKPTKYRDSRFGEVPVTWQLQVPAVGLNLEVRSWPGDYWNPGALQYWEGPVTVSGSHAGEGYLEMTGYGK